MRYDDQDIILADIPGIIEGASQGAGMGFKFLRHISRTKGLAFLIDLSDENFLDSYRILSDELASYAPSLVEKPQVIIASKVDEDESGERYKALCESLPGREIIPLSIYMDETVEKVKQAFIKLVSDSQIKKSDDNGGFTAKVDKDAVYRDEE